MPELRFKREDGTDYPEWEEKILGDNFSFKNGINASKAAFQSDGVHCIGVSDVYKCLPILSSNIIGTVNISENEAKKNNVNYGDILFQRSSETKEDIGHASVYYDSEPAVYNGFVICGKPNFLFYNPIFMHYELQTSRVRKQTISLGAGAQHYNIGQESLSQIRYSIPCINEQNQIGSFLNSFDQKISIQKEKVLVLEKRKKGIMQKLFLQQIRFKDENGNDYPDWKEKRLGDFCNVYAGGTPSTTKPEYWNSHDIKWIQSGVIQNCLIQSDNIKTYISNEGFLNSSAKKIPADTVLLAMTGATCGNVGYLTCEATGNQSVMAFVQNQEIAKFLYYALINAKELILSYSAGGAQSGINKKSCENIIISIPSIPEQKKIADFLSALDEQISIEKQKLKTIEKTKQGLLQKMF